MEQKKPRFFKRLKDAVFNFDEYRTFAEEKLSISIRYLFKLMLLFSLMITLFYTIKATDTIKKAKNYIKNEMPDFKLEENTLIIEGENKKITAGFDQYIGIVVNSETQDIEQTEEINNYKRVIAFLKDKIVIKDENGMQNVMTYNSLNENNELGIKNKQDLINALSSNKMIPIYLIFIAISIAYIYITFTLQILLDIVLISLVGFILSRIIGIRIKYEKIFSISVYSLTLSIILYMIYVFSNLLLNFNIVYFDIAYRLIAYIYLITALFIIKADLIKQNMELTKIVQVQKEVRKELEEKEEEKKKEQKEKKEEKQDNKEKEKSKKNKKKEEKSDEEPQGDQA